MILNIIMRFYGGLIFGRMQCVVRGSDPNPDPVFMAVGSGSGSTPTGSATLLTAETQGVYIK